MKKTFELLDENKAILRDLASRFNTTETKIINDAIASYASKDEVKITEREAELIVDALARSKWGTQIRLNAREAAIDAQVLLEMLNTISYSQYTKYFDTFKTPSPLYELSKAHVEDKINQAKAKRKLL